jgi:hypothetical protein
VIKQHLVRGDLAFNSNIFKFLLNFFVKVGSTQVGTPKCRPTENIPYSDHALL